MTHLEDIRRDGRRLYAPDGRYIGEILYEYIRGSHLYGTATESSDTDLGGIYIAPYTAVTGLGLDYEEELKDTTNDTCYWEIGRFMRLALSSNPTVLEALFVPKDKVMYEHGVISSLKKRRDMFVTKKCFAPFGGYAVSQIKKAQGQNKKIHWDIEKMERKTPIDFCYVPQGQGSVPVKVWLEERGLEQRNCGLVSIPNMPGIYGVYYDWGQDFRLNGVTGDSLLHPENRKTERMLYFILETFCTDYVYSGDFYEENSEPRGGYCGIVSDSGDSNEIRMTSVPDRNLRPICLMSYNANGYAIHCKEYREYTDWVKHRNKARYESNMEGERSGDPDMKYDSKNMMHCFRLMAMATEIAQGKGVILDRTGIDRDFLMDVRNRKYGYGRLNEMMLSMKEKMDEAIRNSCLDEEIDPKAVDEILIHIRNNFV